MRSSLMGWLLIGMIWLITACTGLPTFSLVSPTPQAEQPSPVVVISNNADARLEFLIAQTLKVAEDSVVIRDVTIKEWPDSCLGLPKPTELCAQAIVPGFQAVLETPVGNYILNGDRPKRNFRLLPTSLGAN